MTQLKSTSLTLWQQPHWPSFSWNSAEILEKLVAVRRLQGEWAALKTLLEDSQKLSFIQNDIQSHFRRPLTKERLCNWQTSLFQTTASDFYPPHIGDYRQLEFSRDLQLLPPPARLVTHEMNQFLSWWNESPVGLDGAIRAALAHFWFLVIQPFEDGNLALASALSDLALAQDEDYGPRLYDLTNVMNLDADPLQIALNRCYQQRGDVTIWLNWYFECLIHSMKKSRFKIDRTLYQLKFWQNKNLPPLNHRQKKLLDHLLEQDQPENIAITNKLYVTITRSTRESAKRDLAALARLGLIMQSSAKGRSLHYNFIRR